MSLPERPAASDVPALICEQLLTSAASSASSGMPVRATPIANWGGFVNRSYRVEAGERVVHVKLTADQQSRRGLRRWWTLGAPLAERHGAPEVLDWIELPSVALAGVVLEWIDGETPASIDARQRREASRMIAALHDDADLAARLTALGDAVCSCAAAYRDTFHQRFVDDLREIRRAPPPFVTTALMRWMEGEVAGMLALVENSPAFEALADRPTHRDVWLNNLLATPAGALRLIDWDDVGIGDPMLDWATLLGPTRSALRSAEVSDLPDGRFSSAALERFELLARASLLDWTIDSLADGVEAAAEDDRETVRAEKHRAHSEALAAYRERYAR